MVERTFQMVRGARGTAAGTSKHHNRPRSSCLRGARWVSQMTFTSLALDDFPIVFYRQEWLKGHGFGDDLPKSLTQKAVTDFAGQTGRLLPISAA